jgi:RNA polymerase sigma-32 factor
MANTGTYDTDSHHHYIKKIRGIPLLTVEEESQLAKKWRESQDPKAVDRLISSHLRLVAKIADGYRGYGLPVTDLIAEGNLGMMQAMNHYDHEKGFRFSTYAMWWIRASMQEYILKSWSLVKIGTTSAQKKLFFNLRKTKHSLNRSDENYLTQEHITYIAKKLDVKEEEVIQMDNRLSGKDYSLNTPVSTDSDSSMEWIEWISDESDNQEIQLAHKDEITKRQNLLNEAISCLNEREHLILVDRRLTEPPHTLEALSEKYKISRERVRQIEVKAFEKLHKTIKNLSHPAHHHI